MKTLADHVEEQVFLLLDGGMGSSLEEKKVPLDPLLWAAGCVVDNPDAVADVHSDFLRSGANIITTASYQMSFDGLKKVGVEESDSAIEIFQRSTELALRCRACVCSRHNNNNNSSNNNLVFPLVAKKLSDLKSVNSYEPLVATSIGCYGAALADGSEYRYSPKGYGLTARQLRDWHRPRFDLLMSTGADLFACETIPNVEEVKSLVAIISQYPGPMPGGWISIACRSATELNSGDSIENAVRCIEDPDPYLDDHHRSQEADVTVAVAGIEDQAHSNGNGNGLPTSSIPATDFENLSPRRLAIGVNCTSPRFTCDILDALHEYSHKDRMLVAYPNRGESWEAGAGWVERSGFTDEEFARASVLWYDHGARVIGGCCRVTAATTALMKEYLTQHVHANSHLATK